ncbi:MAG: PAS domain-containing protein [Pseudomonadota bacterium]
MAHTKNNQPETIPTGDTRNESRLAQLNKCFLAFTPDPLANIQRLLNLCGELMQATCAIFNRRDNDVLHTIACWNAPPDMPAEHSLRGSLCSAVLDCQDFLVIRDLQNTPFSQSDSCVKQFQLETYVGYPVITGKQIVGALCVAYQKDHVPGPEDKELFGILATAIGIEEARLKVTKNLQHLAKQMKSLTEISPDPIARIDRNLHYLYCNPAWAFQTGIPPEEFVGKHVFEPLGEIPAAHFLKNSILEVLETAKKQKFEMHFADQTFETWIAPEFDSNGAVASLLCVSREISERIRIEEALLESEEKYRALAENSSDIIVRFDRNLRHLYINPAVMNILGLTPSDLLGKTQRELGFPLGLVELSEKNIQRVFETSDSVQLEFVHNSEEGPIFFDCHMDPEFAADGTVSTVLATIRNTTERKLAEQQREKLQQQLFQSQKMQAVGLLAAGVAHELNNPLCTMVGYAEMLLNTKLPAKALERANKIYEQGHRCQEIIDGLLLFSHQQKPNHQQTSLKNLIKEVIGLGEFQWKRTGVEVVFPIGTHDPEVIVDPNLIKQALLNLLNNAVEASSTGEKVIVELNRPNNYWAEITVSDNGCGVSQEVQSNMFEPFFNTKPVGKGTGLGLSIARGIVTQHEGEILVESTPNKGTTLRVRLPISGNTTDE